MERCGSKARLATKCAAGRDNGQLNWPYDRQPGSDASALEDCSR